MIKQSHSISSSVPLKDELFDISKIRKAVIIADTFTKLLSPISDDLPEALIPICNIPILEFMIDYLTSNSIKEIIICAKNNAKLLEKYIQKFYRKSKNIKLIISEDFANVGDCLRKINNEKLITSDFVLIRGLVITNIDLEKAFIFHQMKKKEDKNCIVTSLMKNYKNDKNVRTNYDENIIIFDPNTKKILQYESTFEKPRVTLNENIEFNVKPSPGGSTVIKNYKVRSDLYDTFIDICSAEMLTIFSENFDYESLREDMYKSVLVSDVYTDTFYLYEISREDYVGIVKNINSYLKVSLEIVNRWAHPIVIENILTSPKLEINYKSTLFSIYFDNEGTSVIDPRSKLVSSVAIGKCCTIEEYCEISSSIIGRYVKISKESKIKNCVIMADTTIGENVIIENSIVGKGVNIESNAHVVNCVLGQGVTVSGEACEQRIYMSVDEETGENVVEKMNKETFMKNLEDRDIMYMCTETRDEEEPGEEEDEEDNLSRHSSDEEENYEDEIKNVISSGIQKKNKIEDILKEVASLKNAFWEKTPAETLKACLVVILQNFMDGSHFQPGHIQKLQELLLDWKNLFSRLIPTEDAQVQFIAVLEDICMEIAEISDAFHIMIQLLNSDELDVINDDVIIAWSTAKESKYSTSDGDKVIPEDFHANFVEKMQKYIQNNLMAA